MPDVAGRAHRDAAARRLEADDAAAGGGHPDRAGAVAGVGDRHQARGDGSGSPAARAARRHIGAPGVVGPAIELRLGRDAPTMLRRVGFADQQEARRLHPPHQLGVLGRDQILHPGRCVGQRRSFPAHADLLEQEGHAGEGRVAIDRGRRGTRHVVEPVHDRVEPRVHAIDDRRRRFDQFGRADLAGPHELAQGKPIALGVGRDQILGRVGQAKSPSSSQRCGG